MSYYNRAPERKGWRINDIELPIPPMKESYKATKKSEIDSIYKFFPQVSQPSGQAYDYTIEGYIYGTNLINQLKQMAESPDIETITISSRVSEEIEPGVTLYRNQSIIGDGIYALKSVQIDRDKPMFNMEGFPVYKYKLTVTEIAARGENVDSLEGDTDLDEDALGDGPLADLLPELEDIENFDYKRFLPIDIAGLFNPDFFG